MLALSLTTDKIQLITSSTADLDVTTHFVDRNQSTGVVGLADRQIATINTATTTDVVAVPGATTTRNVRTMTVRNRHASSSNDVTVQLNANSVLYTLYKTTLLAGESLMYVDQVGFIRFSDAETRLSRSFVKSADQTFVTAATLADITDLSCSGLKSGVRYCFEALLMYVNNAGTTGAQFAVNFGSAPTSILMAAFQTITSSVSAAAIAAGSTNANNTAVIAATTGPTSVSPAFISGSFVPSANDTISLRATSTVTVAAGVTVKAGSYFRVWQPS